MFEYAQKQEVCTIKFGHWMLTPYEFKVFFFIGRMKSRHRWVMRNLQAIISSLIKTICYEDKPLSSNYFSFKSEKKKEWKLAA